MAKELERDLGLYAVITISVGAMVGSGIFILPALAIPLTGPSVVLAYLLAGVLVLPAALSKSEMATAMPESGGTYLYIDRAMGPMMGTIAGLGTWFSLSFKGALALIGGAPYIVLLLGIPVKPLALAIGALLIVVNIVGVKQSGNLQTVIVTTMIAALVGFIYFGATNIETPRLTPFVTEGGGGLLAATGLVFVSYAGVTKIASVAEEIEDPSRNIPLGMLGSLGFTTVLYVLIVFVMVGVVDPSQVAGSDTPMAVAAEGFLGSAGIIIIVLAAVLALVSTANAGILSASRYPLAMARDRLMPDSLADVHERFRTPVLAITVTGGSILLMVAFVPIFEIAKLASAFQILVFVFINIALIAFREGASEMYEPDFRSPLYPWMQIFGIVAGIALLTQMGLVPMIGAVVIIVGGVAWYRYYATGRTSREGVAVDALRREAKSRSLDRTREELEQEAGFRVLVPVGRDISSAHERLLIRLAGDVVAQRGGTVRVIAFDEVPEQVLLQDAIREKSAADIRFEEQSEQLSEELDVSVEVGEVVSHDSERALVNYVEREGIDLILADAEQGPQRAHVFERGLDWMLDEAPCDVVLVRYNEGVREVEEVAVTSTAAPFDPLKVRLADAIATKAGASVKLVHAVGIEASDAHLSSIRSYHDELAEMCEAPARSVIVRREDWMEGLLEAVHDVDVVVLGASQKGLVRGRLLSSRATRIAEMVPPTTLIVRPEPKRKPSMLRSFKERFLFKGGE